jgi:hypothetical protein
VVIEIHNKYRDFRSLASVGAVQTDHFDALA